MKVFVLAGKHPLRSSGGYATYTHILSKCLKELGYEVIILAVSNKDEIEHTDIGTIYSVSSPHLPSRLSTAITATFFLWSNRMDKLLQKLIAGEDKCIVHGIGPWGYAGIRSKRQHGSRVKLLDFMPTTAKHESYWLMKGAEVRDYGIRLKIKYSLLWLYSNTIIYNLEKAITRESDYIIVHHDYAKNQIINDYRINPDKIKKIPHSFEIFDKKAFYTRYDRTVNPHVSNSPRKEEFVCLSVCRQEPRKGINYFLRAIALLKQRNIPVRAIVVGSGDLLQNNIAIARKLKIEDVIQFTGFVSDISEYTKEADVFVQPSLQEGSGSISVLEAMKARIPVITTECDGLPEDIENGKTGLLVPKMDAQSLALAIESLYNDNNLSKSLVLNAEQMLNEKFDFSMMVEGLRSIYGELFSTVKS